jgi:hypothetical protein
MLNLKSMHHITIMASSYITYTNYKGHTTENSLLNNVTGLFLESFPEGTHYCWRQCNDVMLLLQ